MITTALPGALPSVFLQSDAVHIWLVKLDTESPIAALLPTLSSAEQDRAGRFKFAVHRERYIAAHAALRRILAAYLACDPTQLEFGEGPQGKPDLLLRPDQPPLQFNLSHSHQAALVAVTLARSVGVDVEYIKTDFDWAGIVENYFAAGEIVRLKALPAHLQQRAFFAIWTRKESYIKAKGGGLSIPLSSFEVAVHPTEPAALLSCANDPQEAGRWSMATVDVGVEYAATVCAGVPVSTVRLFAWNG